MTRSLVVVESPAKARTIAGFLGDGYAVMPTIGHIRDLPRNEKETPDPFKPSHGRLGGIDPDDHFNVVYVVPQGKKKVVAELKKALKEADELILATDEDREGEAIGWHVLEVLGPKVPVRRMVFHEITPHAIREALEMPRELDLKLVEAQEGRRVLDRLVGYETSPVLWRKIGSQARSAGRVQSVAVRLVVDRERARMAFRSGAWFDIDGVFEAKAIEFPASLAELDGRRVAGSRDFDSSGAIAEGRDVVLLDEAAAAGLAERVRHAVFSVASVERSSFVDRPKAPFTTSTLQQEAGRKFRYPAAKTMAVAQRLYERGYITYMRTDSTALSEQAVSAARSVIAERFGPEFLPPEPRVYRSKVKNAQEAHEAIRPAGDRIRTPDEVRGEVDADEQRLYDLIWVRTIACQMSDARAQRTTLRLAATSSAGEQVVFRAGGVTWEFLGYRRAYVEDLDEEDEGEREATLPAVAEGEPVACSALLPVGHSTKPPSRYTEATLVKDLEERGIGRPSTYAAVIGTIQAREYVWKRGTALIPAWSAFAVTQLLERHFGHLVDYGFTATMEEALDVIARGEGEAEKWLHSFYFGNGDSGLRDLVSDDHLATIDPREVSTVPLGEGDDGVPVVVRVGRYGPYVQRGEENASLPQDLPPDELTLDLAADLIRRQAEGPQALGADPATGLAVYVLSGRYGPYVQLGEQTEGSKEKPRRASLFKSMSPETITLKEALALLSLPRVVGHDAEGNEIVAQNGRFGPYVKCGDETRSLVSEHDLLTIGEAEARALLAQPKRRGRAAKPPLAELGSHPESGASLRVLDGRFGPYVTDGTTNATVPRGTDPTTLSLEEAVALLRAREEAGPVRYSGARKAGGPPIAKTVRSVKKAGGKTTKKTAEKATRKTAEKTAKKTAEKTASATAKKVMKKAAKSTAPAEPPGRDGSGEADAS